MSTYDMRPLKEDPGILAPEIVALQVNGKKYTCKGKVAKKRCTSKSFRVLVRGLDLIQGALTDALSKEELDKRTVFECAVCMQQIWSDPGFLVEPLLPPRNDWRTPGGSSICPVDGGLWTTLHREYRFNTDAAADAKNAKLPLYFDEESNAIGSAWTRERLRARSEALGLPALAEGARVFDNPPYQPVGTVAEWLKFFLDQVMNGVFSVHLVPMSSSVEWFNDLVVPYAEWHTFKGRIAFEDPLAGADDPRVSPKQDNLLVIYDPSSDVVGHTAVRSARTGEYVWRRP